ncbi:hypothetical protein QE177_03285 [Arsenophonus sp. aPb]|uniref:hypothetical protein n=1 Tax=Arsenophonus sp. aPb TaxID=3041619 RepID=UPI002469BECF|nr:hypothetical protein [Arsenophonus sp. aPb]WGL98934.1 hypothetical protein QE177_03285 [Arsenophonus sp. aPb]
MFPISNLSTVVPAAFHNEYDPPNMLLQRLISSSTHIQGENRLLPNGLTARDNFPLLFQIVLDPINEQPEINGFLPSDDFETLYPMIGKQGETTIVAGNYDEIVRFVSHNKAYAIFAIAAFGLPAVSLKQNFDDPETSAIALLFSKTGSLERATNFDETHILGPVDPERVVLLHTAYSDLNTLQPEVVEKLSQTYEQVVNQYINSCHHSTFDIWFSIYPQDEALPSHPIANELTQQQMNNANLERKVEYNNIPHHLLTQSTSQTDTLAEKETVKLVTPKMSTERVLLNPGEFTKARGLKGLSEKYSVDLTTLKDYPQTNSTPSLKGKFFLAGKSNEITPVMLKAIMSLGEDGIAKAGGLKGVSEQYNVRLGTLNNYLNKNGTLTVGGKSFLGDKPNKITPEILTEIMSLGEEGIAKAGGFKGVSEQYNVRLGTLKNYLNKKGTLTVRGEAILGSKPNKITPEILTEIMSLGEDGIAKAGGLKGVSEQYNVRLGMLKSYLNKKGTLTARGEAILGGKPNKITPKILTEIMSLGEDGIAKAGGLKGVSEQYNVRLGMLKSYLNKKGRLTVRGEAILGGKPNKVSPVMLTEIMSSGEDGIAKAGGLKGVSEQYNVRLGTLKNDLNKKGTQKVSREAILGGKPNKVSPVMLTEIMSSGEDRIAKAGGLKGVSEQYNVRLGTLKNDLNKKGTQKVSREAGLKNDLNKKVNKPLRC